MYRKNVGIVVKNKNNLYFCGKRKPNSDNVNSHNIWQMPQGGVDENENIKDAAFREVFEETGISSEFLELIDIYPTELTYDFPEEKLLYGKYKGQSQVWVLFKFTGSESNININLHEPEFCEYKWDDSVFLLQNVVDFKKDIYKTILNWSDKHDLR